MSSLAYVGEVLGFAGDGSSDCSPCGSRRQVVRTLNGLYGDLILAVGAGLSLAISGNTLTLTNTGQDPVVVLGDTVYPTLQGAGGLEEVDTIGITNKLFWVLEGGILRGWRLSAGTGVTDIPAGILRPIAGPDILTKNFYREI